MLLEVPAQARAGQPLQERSDPYAVSRSIIAKPHMNARSDTREFRRAYVRWTGVTPSGARVRGR